MARTVSFNDQIVAKAREVAPNHEFSVYTQVAVREKLDRELRKRAFVITEPTK